MSGRDWQLPVGDRDREDDRSARPVRDLSPAPSIPARLRGEGFCDYLKRLAETPGVVESQE